MKIRTHAIKSLYLASILSLPGCVLFPQVDNNLAPIVVPVERNELSTVVKNTNPKELTESKVDNQIDEGPGKVPAFSTLKNLTTDDLVREVQGRNPTLTAMIAASEAAWSKYPQAKIIGGMLTLLAFVVFMMKPSAFLKPWLWPTIVIITSTHTSSGYLTLMVIA